MPLLSRRSLTISIALDIGSSVISHITMQVKMPALLMPPLQWTMTRFPH